MQKNFISKLALEKTVKTKCIKCGRTYINYNDLCTTCRGIKANPFHVLNCLDDGIDIGKEQDLIYNEIEERHHRDFPLDRKPQRRKALPKTGKGLNLKNHPYPDYILKKIEKNRTSNIVDVGEE